MKVPGVKTGTRFGRWMRARILGGGLILGYHRVAAPASDADDLCTTPSHFADHLEILRNYAQPISLSELVDHLGKGTLPARSIAVTFDDGYADNLYDAKPLLEKYEIPATVFVCTGYLGREFWWDELHRLVVSSRADLTRLCAEITPPGFRLEKSIAEDDAKDSVREEFFGCMYRWLLGLRSSTREKVMDAVRAWAEVESDDSSGRRALTSMELIRLAQGALIEIGAHTTSHPMLTGLTVEEQTEEIVSSKQYLEQLLDRRVGAFAYPNGATAPGTREILVRTGFRFACCSEVDLIRPGQDRYSLPRFWPGDQTGEKFLRQLKLWL